MGARMVFLAATRRGYEAYIALNWGPGRVRLQWGPDETIGWRLAGYGQKRPSPR